ncbi:MAG: efflux RND transporter periplasmic adaptor subunit [Pseudomonadota bacterium]
MRHLAAIIFSLGFGGVAAADTVTAVLEPARSVELRSTVNGRVAGLDLKEGETVAAGLVVAEVDARVQKARVDLAEVIARADGASVRAERLFDQAVTLRDRVANAHNKGAAQDWELLAAEQAVALAEADRQVAQDDMLRRQAELALEKATLAEFDITAPFDAVVLEVMVEQGEIIDTGTVLLEIGTIEQLTATAFVPLDWSKRLKRDSGLDATTEFGETVAVEVDAIDPRVDPASQTVRVVFSVSNDQKTLLPGTTLNIEAPK